eukprot:UN01210
MCFSSGIVIIFQVMVVLFRQIFTRVNVEIKFLVKINNPELPSDIAEIMKSIFCGIMKSSTVELYWKKNNLSYTELCYYFLVQKNQYEEHMRELRSGDFEDSVFESLVDSIEQCKNMKT